MKPLRSEDKIFDHYFMNHAYLSEKWLQQYLALFKEMAPAEWDDTLEDQLNDEVRHTKMCRTCLLGEGIQPIEDVRYSIQNALYLKVGGIKFPPPTSKSVVMETSFAIERRAALIYKLYLRHGTIERYRQAIQSILDDEERHKENTFHPSGKPTTIRCAEERTFKEQLPRKYGHSFTGSKTFTNLLFWQDLFCEAH